MASKRKRDGGEEVERVHDTEVKKIKLDEEDNAPHEKSCEVLIEEGIPLKEFHKSLFLRQKPGNCVAEIVRIQYLQSLSELYNNECQKYFGWAAAPHQSFIRWQTEGFIYDNIDPLLPSNKKFGEIQTMDQIDESVVITREIIEDFPAKISPNLQYINKYGDLQSHISKYIKALEEILRLKQESYPKEIEERDQINTSEITRILESQLEDLKHLCHNQRDGFNAQKANYLKLHDEIYANLKTIFGPVASFLSKKMQFTSLEYARKIISNFSQASPLINNSNNGDDDDDDKTESSIQSEEGDNSLNIENNKSLSPFESSNNYSEISIEVTTGSETKNELMKLILSYNTDQFSPIDNIQPSDLVVTIPTREYKSLFDTFKQFYAEYVSEELDTSNIEQFILHKLWVLTKRYKGASLQASVHPDVMELLRTRFGVQFECFASPFNNYFQHYTSAFEDSDCGFGSLGSFFQFRPTQGAFQAAPPVCEIMYKYTADHILSLLNNSTKPLTFIVFLVHWEDAEGYVSLTTSKYYRNTKKCVASGRDHKFILQRCLDTPNNTINGLSSMAIIYLMNDAAFNIVKDEFHKFETEIFDKFANANNNNDNNYSREHKRSERSDYKEKSRHHTPRNDPGRNDSNKADHHHQRNRSYSTSHTRSRHY